MDVTIPEVTIAVLDTVFIPDSRFHATHNSGLDPMEIFVVYSPTGPEKMLQDAPDFRLIPANELTGD